MVLGVVSAAESEESAEPLVPLRVTRSVCAVGSIRAVVGGGYGFSFLDGQDGFTGGNRSAVVKVEARYGAHGGGWHLGGGVGNYLAVNVDGGFKRQLW